MTVYYVPRESLCEILRAFLIPLTARLDTCIATIEHHLQRKLTNEGRVIVLSELKFFLYQFKKRYKKFKYSWVNYVNYESWNQAYFEISKHHFEAEEEIIAPTAPDLDELMQDVQHVNFEAGTSTANMYPTLENSIDIQEALTQPKRGRPATSLSNDFESLAPSTQRRDVKKLSNLAHNDVKKLILTSANAAKSNGNKNMWKVLNFVYKNYENAKDILKNLVTRENELSVDEALNLFLDKNLSKRQYTGIKQCLKKKTKLPPYLDLCDARKKCWPEEIEVTDTKVGTTVSNLVEHTLSRIIEMQKDQIINHMNKNSNSHLSLTFVMSCGMDGSTGFSNYNIAAADGSMVRDDSFFITMMVPLDLKDRNGYSHWRNRSPQSVRFVRALSIECVKESIEHIKQVYKDLNDQINVLQVFQFTLEQNKILYVHVEIFHTLIDGKVFNAITDTKSSQNCALCKCSPNDFNNYENLINGKFKPSENSLKHNCQPLHAIINTFTCLLNISYRLKIKKWRVTNARDKIVMKEEKKKVLQNLKDEFHILFAVPKTGGSGNSTSGNLCRRAFREPKKLASALGIDEKLVINISAILSALNSQVELDPQKLNRLCHKTFKIYVEHYEWYKMPATLHKILAHSSDIVLSLPLPTGFFSEEGAEAQNKNYKFFRTYRARKNSRVNNLIDVYHKTLEISDPLISTRGQEYRLAQRKKRGFSDKVKRLFKKKSGLNSNETDHSSSTDEDGEDDDDDEEDENENINDRNIDWNTLIDVNIELDDDSEN